jgi:antitoxin (DNA-binding transcriptional repressor) of toxin-antitoxin stability system
MKRIDLDDLPPKIAALLAGAAEGEELVLVQGGVVVGRLVAGAPEPAPRSQADPDQPSEEKAKEIFELFRSSVEDEF